MRTIKKEVRNHNIRKRGKGIINFEIKEQDKRYRYNTANAKVLREICWLHFETRCSLFGSCFLSISFHFSAHGHLSLTLQPYRLRTSSQAKRAGIRLSCCADFLFFPTSACVSYIMNKLNKA